jgi:putative endonuclease
MFFIGIRALLAEQKPHATVWGFSFMAFTIYVLYSQAYDRLYIGQTEDLKHRLSQHANGEVFSTKPYLPMKLIYTEEASTRAEAMRREKQLKTRTGRVWLRANCL